MVTAAQTKTVKQTPLLQEFREFLLSTPPDTPYHELPKYTHDAGWVWQFRQQGAPVPHANGIVVTFDIYVGKTTGAMEYVDAVTMNPPALTQHVSLAARIEMTPSILYLLFGRLPPQQPKAEDAPLPGEQPPVDDDGIQTAKPNGAQAPGVAVGVSAAATGVEVTTGRTPEGWPIFDDLYALGAPGVDVVDAVLAEIQEVLPSMSSQQALDQLWDRNEQAFAFVKDFGEVEQRSALKHMLEQRAHELEGAEAPRRRSPQPVH